MNKKIKIKKSIRASTPSYGIFPSKRSQITLFVILAIIIVIAIIAAFILLNKPKQVIIIPTENIKDYIEKCIKNSAEESLSNIILAGGLINSNNNFRFIPKSIEGLKSLERLNFSYTYIRYVHNEVCLLPSLKHLNLFYNDIQSLFKNIIFLNKVQYINPNRNLIIYFSIDYLKYCRSVRHMIIHRNPRNDKAFKHNPYLLRFENDRNNDKVIKDCGRFSILVILLLFKSKHIKFDGKFSILLMLLVSKYKYCKDCGKFSIIRILLLFKYKYFKFVYLVKSGILVNFLCNKYKFVIFKSLGSSIV